MEKPKILGLIPARGGSKGIPRKNIKLLDGKPLLAWTIETAIKAGCLNKLVLSTEDEEIAAVGRKHGCEVPFIRPKELALDDTPGIVPVLHALDWFKKHEGYEPDYVMLLQPTSPFRTSTQIKEVVDLALAPDFETFDSIVSVVEPHHPPQWMFTSQGDDRLRPLLSDDFAYRRQELPMTYALNGAIYLTRTVVLRREETFLVERTKGYLMDRVTSLDLDTGEDWQIAESYIMSGIIRN
ncbi:MAG: acylneuraminate cytidylyltransferase family protein [Desulfitobacteriaceae bacterium]